jgi:hypothetical protein
MKIFLIESDQEKNSSSENTTTQQEREAAETEQKQEASPDEQEYSTPQKTPESQKSSPTKTAAEQVAGANEKNAEPGDQNTEKDFTHATAKEDPEKTASPDESEQYGYWHEGNSDETQAEKTARMLLQKFSKHEEKLQKERFARRSAYSGQYDKRNTANW